MVNDAGRLYWLRGIITAVTETVPGMADAIEKRWPDRFKTVAEFAAAVGLSPPALLSYRRGERKDAVTTRPAKRQIAIALNWPLDWYDRLVAGEIPEDWPEQAWAEDRRRGLLAERARIDAELAELDGVTYGGGAFRPPVDADNNP